MEICPEDGWLERHEVAAFVKICASNFEAVKSKMLLQILPTKLKLGHNLLSPKEAEKDNMCGTAVDVWAKLGWQE